MCVTILYGTETGNSQNYAEYIYKTLLYYQISAECCAADSFPLKKLVTDTQFLIIICATTGQGELPRNITKFMKFILKKKLPGDLLSHIRMTSFGLGDSSYPKYNVAMRKVHARLVQLGCQELSPRAEGDEMSPEGVDAFFIEWFNVLLPALTGHFGLVQIDQNQILPPQTKMNFDLQSSVITDCSKEVALRRTHDLTIGKVFTNERLTDHLHFQDIRHLILESDNLAFVPGDTLELYPANLERHVDLLFESQPHWYAYADRPLDLSGRVPAVDGGFVTKLTLRSLITHHLDIMSIPRRSFFTSVWRFVDDSTEDGQREKEKLREFGLFDDPEALYNYANRPRRLILETIQEFDHNLKIPVEHILDVFPVIKPRQFSIASRPSPNRVELVIAIVEYKTVLRRIRRGLCTTWLKLLQQNDRVVLLLKQSNFKFHTESNQYPPLIMISPGTGIAPMKSLIEHCHANNTHQPLYLFYGCRYREKDFLFQQLWDQLSNNGSFRVFPCFSRESDSKPKYVQDMVYEQRELIADLIIHKDAVVFVCGSSGKMPREVRVSIQEALSKAGLDDPEGYVKDMENKGRYLEDTW